MTKERAFRVLAQLEKIMKDNGIWYTIELENRPELRMISLSSISIKITEAEEKK